MLRIGIPLLLAATIAAAGDIKNAYNQAKRKRDPERKEFAAQQAAALAGSVEGSVEYLYLGLLWQYAEDWDKAVEAFRGYLAGAKPKAKNRARATLEIAHSQLNAKKYAAAAATADEFGRTFKGHPLLGRARYCQGRALRVEGNLDAALEAFRRGHNTGHKLSTYEVADCMMQLGDIEGLKAFLAEAKLGDALRWKTLKAALENLGKRLPAKLPIDFWVGHELGMGEIKAKPTLWSFWTTKVGNARDAVHDITNAMARRYKGKIHVIGPALYLQFNPVEMKSVPDMSKKDEQGFVLGWKDQYKLQYDVILLNDDILHRMCGVDPQRPVLPAFAITDNKGVLRYVRVGPEEATAEALASMLARLTK